MLVYLRIMVSEFGAYTPDTEAGSQERYAAWQAAIGLQSVDGLQTSPFLQETAIRHVEGVISIDEARQLIHSYYEDKGKRTTAGEDASEADMVAANIAKLLGEHAFSFCPAALWETHKRIFEGVFPFAGESRKINIRKKEWVLGGASVAYSPVELIRSSIQFDFERERAFNYATLDLDGAVRHIANFISGVWQIHPFAEGNTRTTAVFLISYLRFMGFDVDNSMFEKHSWYFRNALVRANYSNRKTGVERDFTYLEKFLRNLLMGERHELKNRYLRIHEALSAEQVTEQVTEQVQETLPDTVALLVARMGDEVCSVRELMQRCGLKHRPSFLQNYLQPAMGLGLVRMLHPEQPRHPRQKYMLSVRGLLLKNSSPD